MTSINWTDDELKAAGISKRSLQTLLRKFADCVERMNALGLSVYAESGTGYLIHKSRPEHDERNRADMGAVVAEIGQGFDGGAW